MGGPKYKTLEVEISYQTLQVLDLKTAGVLSLIQMAITLLIVFWERRLKVGGIRFSKIKVFDENLRSADTVGEKLITAGVIGSVLLITVLPMFSLLFRSLYVPGSDMRGSGTGTGFSLVYYKNLFYCMFHYHLLHHLSYFHNVFHH